MTRTTSYGLGLVAMAFTLSAGIPAWAGSAMSVAGTTRGPAAAAVFCQSNPGVCRRVGKGGTVSLTPDRWSELQAVNAAVNGSVAEVTDIDQFGQEDVWSLPSRGRGDCEDFALLKRQMLIQRGWPSAALLVTVVTTESGEGHAVLTVVTDQGDYVLDNKVSSVRLWTSTGYQYFVRQSQGNPRAWVWIGGPRAAEAASWPRVTAGKR